MTKLWHSDKSCAAFAYIFDMKNVLLIDSGSGGINILKKCVQVCPFCNFLMFCDDKNLPYGNKSKQLLQEITLKNLQNIYQFFKFDIVILACNTLTSTCIDVCRKTFPDIVFIGTVPAIKPALEKYKPEDVLLLATENTIKHNILARKNKKLTKKPLNKLAELIDENLDNLSVLKGYLTEELQELHPKAVVLGCTHYVAVADLIKSIFKNAEIFDSADGVARRLKSFVDENVENFQVQIMISGDEKQLPKFWWYFNKN